MGRLFLTISPLFPAFFAATLRLYPYGGSIRTMLYMAPFLCILAGIGFPLAAVFIFFY